MVSAHGSTRTKEVLLGRGGSEESLGQLAAGLRDKGFRVREERASPVGAHDTGDTVAQALDGYDVVLLVVHKADGEADPARPFERVLRDADTIEQALGDGRVVLLVEETVNLPDTHFAQVRFPTSRADMALQDVIRKIDLVTAEPVRDLHARVPMTEQAAEDALRVPWLLVLVVVASAAIPLALALNSFRGEDTTRLTGLAPMLGAGRVPLGDAGAGTVDTPPAAGDEASQGDEAQGGGAASGQDTAGGAAPGEAGDTSGSDQGDPVDAGGADQAVPASPSVTLGGANDLLPASCVIDLSKGTLLSQSVTCDGPGAVSLEGWDGPWHNEVAAIAVASGVVGEFSYEGTDDVLVLAGDAVVLDPEAASYGARQLSVTFSADDQHVHLFRNADGSGEFATLRFTLDR